MENIYVQFDDMVYQQKAGIPMGTNFALLIVDLFLYCYEIFYVKPPEIQMVWPHRQVQRYISIPWRYLHHWLPWIC